MSARQGAAPIDPASAEERILKAATEEFAANGFYGARTQAIADAAGVNKAMLHYYFRSKENLYSQVIGAALKRILTRVGMSWAAEGSLEARVEKVVETYMDGYEQNPALLKIVLREVVDGGSRLKRAAAEMKKAEFAPDGLSPIHWIRDASREVGVPPAETIHFLVNLIGMCLVSFISPLFLESILDLDVSDMKRFLRDRRRAVKSMVFAFLENPNAGKSRK
jgi:TetR/AcrR family transcriptional regulator